VAYRKAKRIELHEAHTAITTSEEQNNFAARGDQINRTAFLVRPSDITALAQQLGWNLSQPVREQPASDPVEEVSSGKPVLLRAFQEIPTVTSGIRIITLECDVQSANLVDIRIASQVENESPEAPHRIELITHSGSFTIWWAEEASSDIDHRLAVAEAHPTIPTEETGEVETIVAQGTVIDIALEEADGDGIETAENDHG
jgi:hypothetical protein